MAQHSFSRSKISSFKFPSIFELPNRPPNPRWMPDQRWQLGVFLLTSFVFLLSGTIPGTIPSTAANNTIPEKGSNKKSQGIINDILHGYDKNTRPYFETGDVVNVNVSIFVNSLDSINEINMEYKVKMYLRMMWTDPRLAYGDKFQRDSLNIDARLFDNFWVPDLFFINEKSGDYHKVTTLNKLIRVYPNGTVTSSMRLTLVLQCPMDLHDYPLDNQACPMELESYAYDKNDVDFFWASYEPVQINEDIGKLDLVPEFTLRNTVKERGYYNYTLGVWSYLKVSFYFDRRLGYYLSAVYFPSVITVVLSWVAFWIDLKAVPARICIGFLTVLTTITQSSGIRNSLPRVSYIKAVDIWMVTCLIYVAAALVEYAIAHAILISYTKFTTVNKPKAKKKLEVKSEVAQPEANADAAAVGNEKGSPKPDSLAVSFATDPPSLPSPEPKLQTTPAFRARRLDEVSRIIFPFSFLIFNLFYWIYYNHSGVFGLIEDPDLG